MEFLSVKSASTTSDIIIAVFLAVFAIGCMIGLVMLLCRFANDDGKVRGKAVKMLLFLVAGFVLRLVFALCVRGFRSDYAVFVSMFDNLRDSGLAGYYGGSADGVLYPVVYFVYLIFGGLSNATGLSDYGLGMQFMIKLPLIIADLFAAFALYIIAKRYFNPRVAITVFAFVCICPIFFIGSSLWTSPITFTVMFMCFACYFLARKKYAATIAFATAAAFSSKEGIYLFPMIAVFSIFHFVRAIKNLTGAEGNRKLIGENSAAWTVPLAFVLSLVGAYLIGLFMIGSYSYDPFDYIYKFLLAPLVEWKYFTVNGLSIYSLFNRSGIMPGARFPAWLFASIFAVILTVVVCVVYFTKRNRATLVMLGTFCLLTMQIYYPGASAISMESTLLLLLVSYLLVKDKRILTVLFVIGLMYVINSVTTLSDIGQLNNLTDFDLSEAAQNVSAAAKSVSIVCSVFAVLAHLYYTVIAVSVGMTGQKRELMTAHGFKASLKEFFAIRKGK